VAAVDPHDAVGVLDKCAFDVRFFTEIERFDRHLEKLRRGTAGDRVDYVSVCSPNYLHDAHIRLALRVGATSSRAAGHQSVESGCAPGLENETGGRVNTVYNCGCTRSCSV
jgi:UDP-N-acetyl-2-amino-2-deoxyglucuronate dehydrogenase